MSREKKITHKNIQVSIHFYAKIKEKTHNNENKEKYIIRLFIYTCRYTYIYYVIFTT